MDSTGFESQHVPTFYHFSKCPESLVGHTVLSSISSGQFNQSQNGWFLMLWTTLYSVTKLRKVEIFLDHLSVTVARILAHFHFLPFRIVCTYIYLCRIKYLGTLLIWVKMFQEENLWFFNRTRIRPSSRCTQVCQSSTKRIIYPRLLLHALEALGWDANLSE